MYSTVLIPTDGSEGAAEAIEAGLTLAARFDSTVHALFVIDERFVEAEFDPAVEAAERRGERALDRAGQQGTDAGIDVEKHIRRGVPHEEIRRAADDYGADIVVLGTHGRTGLDRLFHLGSVTERVVRSASVKVLTVPIGSESADE